MQAISKKGIASAQSRRQRFRVFRMHPEQLPQLILLKFSVPNITLDMFQYIGLRSESLRPQNPRYLIEPPGAVVSGHLLNLIFNGDMAERATIGYDLFVKLAVAKYAFSHRAPENLIRIDLRLMPLVPAVYQGTSICDQHQVVIGLMAG